MRSSILIVFAALLAACGGSDKATTAPIVQTPTPTPTVTNNVNMVSLAFTPASIQVTSGAVVNFTNSDGFSHNVTFTDATITGLGNFSTGSKTVSMPAAAGTYPYRCTLHSGMSGSVTVK